MAARSRFTSITSSFLGFFIGGIAAVLVTPRSGKQSRELIIKTARSLKREK